MLKDINGLIYIYNSYNRIIWEAYLKNYFEEPIGKSEWFENYKKNSKLIKQ